MRKTFGGIALGLVLSSAALWGEPMIDFSGYGTGGTISSAGLGSAVIGGGILIKDLNGIGVPVNEGLHQVTGSTSGSTGILSFQTGAITSVTNNGGQYTYTFNGGGTFSIQGNVPDAGITGNPVLLSGSFYDGSFSITDTGSGYLAFFQGSGSDTKSSDLLSYFGLPDTPFRFAGYSIGSAVIGEVGSNGSFASLVSSTGIINTAAPEPSAILLLGSCLLLIGGLLRRKMNRERTFHAQQ